VSEIQERIEREMFEIRSRMSPDMKDLREHLESQIVAEQVKQTIRQRLRQTAEHGKANLKAKQQDLAYSAKRPLSLVRRKISNGRGE
jgi:macrodomain Ter protein organizer (MatP/YcbG family)